MSRHEFGLGACACLSVLLAACASSPPPTGELSRAKTLIDQADGANVHRYAAADLEEARNKYQEAEKAAAADENDMARRRADEAAAAAEAATARARESEAKQAAAETQKSLETLRQEAARGIPVARPQ
jgi:uncharacterized protein DUF4398